MSSKVTKMDQSEFQSYKAAFQAFDWNHNGKISYTSLQVNKTSFTSLQVDNISYTSQQVANMSYTSQQVDNISYTTQD